MTDDMTCPTCGGDGELATSHRFTCYTCAGSGVLADPVERAAALEIERRIVNRLAAAVTVSEYRQMGS